MFELCYVHGEHTRRIVRIVHKRFRHVSCPDNSIAIGRVINYLSEITNNRSRLTGPISPTRTGRAGAESWIFT